MTDRLAAALTASASAGLAIVTRPAPARNAPRAASRAAPVDANPPDTTTAWPREYLWPSICGTGKAPLQRLGPLAKMSRPDRVQHAVRDADVGDLDRPAMQPSRQQQMAGLSAEEGHAVSLARTAAPMTAPLSPLMPLGRSTARIGTPEALIASIIARASPSTGRSRPGAEQGIDDEPRPGQARAASPARSALASGRPPSAASPLSFAAVAEQQQRGPETRGRPGSGPRQSRRRHCCPGRPRPAPAARRADSAAPPRRRRRGRHSP